MGTTSLKDNSTIKSYIAFFDLDHTIISANSGKILIKYAYKHKLITKTDMLRGIGLSLLYRFGLMDTAKIIDKMVSWLKGVPEESLNSLAATVFTESISKSIHMEVKPEITFHKDKGARTVILSSAVRPVCQSVAYYLGMNDIICSDLEVQDGNLTGRPLNRLCFGPEKAARLKEYCERNNSTSSDAWYYGDSISDLTALILAGNPVCVNPDKKLEKEAHKRGWKILRWHSK